MVRIVALIVVAVLAAAPAAALGAAQAPTPAQSLLGVPPSTTPAQEQPVQQAPAQQAPAQQTEADSGSISGAQVVLIGLAVVALIGGIWFVIARDARRATAGRVRTADAEVRGGSATRAARRSRKLSAAEKQRRKRGRAR